jgi:hypothetical protein
LGDIEKPRENHLPGPADNKRKLLRTVSAATPLFDPNKYKQSKVSEKSAGEIRDVLSAPAPRQRQIFISYRRQETAYPANSLYKRLAERYGHDQVFMDVDTIKPGDDFVATITTAVNSCDVLLALIGDRWLTITDSEGQRRIDDPHDFVRLEIETALAHDVRVIPLLVDGATMPRAADLPTSIAGLAFRQALELSPNRFDLDLDRLLKVLDETLLSSGD